MAHREVCFLIGTNQTLLWSDASGSPTAMPDSRRRWQAIWDRREKLCEIAHSHPTGPAAFSAVDESTMAALTSALGRKLRFSVVAPRAVVVRAGGADLIVDPEPWWADLLRLASGIEPVTPPTEGA
jgi:hypothetical protein